MTSTQTPLDIKSTLPDHTLIPANERGLYSIEPMGVELGIWQGRYQNLELPWLR